MFRIVCCQCFKDVGLYFADLLLHFCFKSGRFNGCFDIFLEFLDRFPSQAKFIPIRAGQFFN